jgi:Domain of unknown function (DUF4189)
MVTKMKLKTLYRAALTLTAALCMSSAFAVGAIAVDDEEGEDEPGYGFSSGHDTKEEASKAAMRECKKAGNTACKVVVWFETCGAYAASKKYYGVGWGSNAAKASQMALDKCGNRACKIKISECE